ncbi:class I SAM-dependent methyltransferase [Pseudoalteromonas spongiae]|uniref:class I SAM-dependent methyltransferase n=1 Tax=Pseudoalteromonas spongiae TaxID=298657 RepID=UPI00110BB086|nr:class I SAM-dependent methyltransferase [Pseudoalteromonas spongiae]TMO83647.1 hypothetical protein CWC15_14410 [Pseudoalteromonas spongiae]
MIMSFKSSMLTYPKKISSPYAWTGHIPFLMELVELHCPKIAVELGTHTGNSFNALCQSVDENEINTKCYAVDCWLGDPQAGYYGEEVFNELNEYVSAEYGHLATLKKMYFDDAVQDFDDDSIDLLHIDGLHTYEAVKNDFETWLPKMSGSGIILFHDTYVFERGFGVHQLWGELSQQYPSFEFTHSHGLGVLLIGRNINKDVLNFIDELNRDINATRKSYFSNALAILPDEARVYLQRLELKELESNTSPQLTIELFLSASKEFSEDKKYFKQFSFEYGDAEKLDVKWLIEPDNKFARIDPCIEACLLSSEFRVVAETQDGKKYEPSLLDSNHLDFIDDSILFPQDPQLIFELHENTVSIHFRGTLLNRGSAVESLCIERYGKLRRSTDALIEKYREKQDSILNLVNTKSSLQSQLSNFQKENLELKYQLKSELALKVELTKQVNFLTEALELLKSNYKAHIAASDEAQGTLYQARKQLIDKFNNLSNESKLVQSRQTTSIFSLKSKLEEKNRLLEKLIDDKAFLIDQLNDSKRDIESLQSSINQLENSKSIRFARLFSFLSKTKS